MQKTTRRPPSDNAGPAPVHNQDTRWATGCFPSTSQYTQTAEYDLLNFLAAVDYQKIGNMAMDSRSNPAPGRSVLVVDDDLELLLTYQELLQAHNYEATTAENGAEALKLMKHRKVDAILCDLDMPELSGDLFYFEVGRVWPELLRRFIFVTGNAENPTYENFLKSTKANVLPKPFSIERLLEKLHAVLGVAAQPAN